MRRICPILDLLRVRWRPTHRNCIRELSGKSEDDNLSVLAGGKEEEEEDDDKVAAFAPSAREQQTTTEPPAKAGSHNPLPQMASLTVIFEDEQVTSLSCGEGTHIEEKKNMKKLDGKMISITIFKIMV
jgi:hypothetical protein